MKKENKPKNEVKNKLNELRVAAGLKQSELAELVGCSQQTISNYETGFVNNIDSIVEEAIANYFSCSIDYLRGLSDIKNAEEYVNDAILLKNEFVKLGIIKEGDDISKQQLKLFRDIIKANKPFLKQISHLSNDSEPNESDNNNENED